MWVMQGTQEDINRAIMVLAESVLMPRILTFYEEVETTSKTKQEQKDMRRRHTKIK